MAGAADFGEMQTARGFGDEIPRDPGALRGGSLGVTRMAQLAADDVELHAERGLAVCRDVHGVAVGEGVGRARSGRPIGEA